MLRDPEHRIFPDAWTWHIIEFHWRGDATGDPCRAYVDMTFSKADQTRHLRFLAPKEIYLDGGFRMTWGFAILDISGRGWEDKVEVINFECSSGSPTFIAADVFDLDDPANDVRKCMTDF